MGDGGYMSVIERRRSGEIVGAVCSGRDGVVTTV
jgi:hypothetical protein